MATTNSTQYGNTVAVPPVMNAVNAEHGRVRVAAFDYTQAAQGSAGDDVNLVKLPAGSIRVLSVYVAFSAFGASRTLDLGYGAIVELSDGTTTAADPDGISANTDISGAGAVTSTANKTISSTEGVIVSAQVNDGTLPAAATLNGYVLYVVD